MLDKTVNILLLVSALVHGMLLFGVNIVQMIANSIAHPWTTNVIYLIMLLAGVRKIFTMYKNKGK